MTKRHELFETSNTYFLDLHHIPVPLARGIASFQVVLVVDPAAGCNFVVAADAATVTDLVVGADPAAITDLLHFWV